MHVVEDFVVIKHVLLLLLDVVSIVFVLVKQVLFLEVFLEVYLFYRLFKFLVYQVTFFVNLKYCFNLTIYSLCRQEGFLRRQARSCFQIG